MNTNPSIVVVCHDAGGAEIISAYVKKHWSDTIWHCYAAGPAEKIFSRKNIPHVSQSKDRWTIPDILGRHTDAAALLVDIGWSSPIEIEALRSFKAAGIKTIVYMDHWVHYKERFGFPHAGWERNLPDELWVGDAYAEQMARDAFPSLPMLFVPNAYFEEIKQEYAQRSANISSSDIGILFISEPLSEAINTFGDTDHVPSTEYDILEDILMYCRKQHIKEQFIIRLHPSEHPEKYQKIIARYEKDVAIMVSSGRSIYDDLISVRMVIGMESMALVVALLCGKKVVSYFHGKSCPLPFADIKVVHTVHDLNRVLPPSSG